MATENEDKIDIGKPAKQLARFTQFLGRDDGRGPDEFRAALLAESHLPHRIGFRRKNLENAFSANLSRLFPDIAAVDEPGIDGKGSVLMYGAILDDAAKSHDSTKKLLPHVRKRDRVLFFEMGFLASTTSWSEALASRDRDQACLGYIFDDRAQYYMSDYESRLDQKLNGDFQLTPEERARAESVMRRIVDARISKYNSQPFFRPQVSPDYPRRVLVVDQNYSDASTYYGRATAQDFAAMLEAAIAENPDAEILVKTHPDLNWVKGGQRSGYFDHMESEGRVRLIRDGVNPFEMFDLVDKVYVGTSGMGLEALLAGKEVVCFGAPCYAGWGLTDDRVEVPHRHRKRDLAEFFHAFYIWYTIYHLPEGQVPSQIEDVLDFIEANRPVRPIPREAFAEPSVSIVIPVHGVENYVAECLISIQRQTLQDFEVILIDDVSPDRSAEVVASYCESDPRFRLIRRTENIGPGFARNQGVDLARGRYVLFIDPDDFMPDTDHLRRVVDMADADGADMVRYRKKHEQIEGDDGTIAKLRPDATEQFFPEELHRVSVTSFPQIAHSRHFWNWLYRRDFLNANRVRFLTTYREERAFLLQAYMANPVISVADSNGVVYRIRPDSAVRRVQTMSDVVDQLQNFDLVMSQLAANGALDRNSSHWWLARFQVSQFLHYLYFGFAWKTAKRENQEQTFIDMLATTLERAGMDPQDLIGDPSQLSRDHLQAGAYGLLMAATRLRRRDLIDLAHSLEPIPADLLYREYRKEPASAAERGLQAALNVYARNERVGDPEKSPRMTKRRPRLIIHIGATKTGSTALQHLLEDNRPSLLRAGIWYPEVGLFWQADRPHKQAGHVRFAAEAIGKDQGLRQHLLTGLALMPGHVNTIILSSEAFFLNPNSIEMVKHFHDFEVEMVVYLRRQDEWANSQYSEFVAGGAMNSTALRFPYWLTQDDTRAWLNYGMLVRRWEEKLPKNRIHVRRYLRSKGSSWDIIADFAEATGLPQIAALPPLSRDKANDARLSTTHVELIRQYNKRSFPNKKAYLSFVEEVTVELTKWRNENGLPMHSPWFLTDELADKIMETFAPGNNRLAREYFGVETGDLFPPRASAPEECAIYMNEFTIAETAYANRKKAPAKGPAKAKDANAPLAIVNYGVFGWRLWLSVPLMSKAYRLRGRGDLATELSADPARFAQEHWLGRHPKLRWLAYSKGSVLGPGKVLRVWVPLIAPLVRRGGGEDAAKRLKKEPVRFARGLRNPVARLAGRLLFPMGERT